MLNIVAGVRYLQVITSGAYSLDWTVSYRSHHGERIVREIAADNVSTATTTTILGIAGIDPVIYYECYEVHLKNRDASNSNTVTLITDAVGGGDVKHISPAITLAAGETFVYSNGSVYVLDSDGRTRDTSVGSFRVSQSAPSATTETDLYTVGTGVSAELKSINICNRGAASGTFRLSISVGGGATANKDYLQYDTTLAANAVLQITDLGFANASDKVRVYASSGDFSFNLFSREF